MLTPAEQRRKAERDAAERRRRAITPVPGYDPIPYTPSDSGSSYTPPASSDSGSSYSGGGGSSDGGGASGDY